MRVLDDIPAPAPGPSYGGLFSTRVYEAESGGTIRLDDAALLFKGEFARFGSDLVISDASTVSSCRTISRSSRARG